RTTGGAAEAGRSTPNRAPPPPARRGRAPGGRPGPDPPARPRRYVETVTQRRLSIERQCRVGLGEMEMTAHLNGPVTGVRDGETDGRPIAIRHDDAGRWKNLAGRHDRVTIAKRPPAAAIAPIVRNATLPIGPPARRHIPMPAAWSAPVAAARPAA